MKKKFNATAEQEIMVRLFLNASNPYGDFDPQTEKDTSLRELGLGTIDELHEMVRTTPAQYTGYQTHRISVVDIDGIHHRSPPLDVSGITWFGGMIKRAEDMRVYSDPQNPQETKPYTDVNPRAAGKIFYFSGEGRTVTVDPARDRVIDRATNKQIWPQPVRPTSAPRP